MSDERFTFFYGGPFSNWAVGSFVVDGVRFSTAEQYMMVGKARLFGDAEAERKMLAVRDPERVKILGRGVRGFNKAAWEAAARDIVYKGCYEKFQQNPGFLHALRETAGTTLVEASRTDQIWGIGLDADDERAKRRATWMGTNWLGEVLTLVRDDLAAGTYRTSNFCWSGAPAVGNDVEVVNDSGGELWIWDVDKMRRTAFDLKHEFPGTTGVVVTVRPSPLEGCHEVLLSASSSGTLLSERAASRTSVLDAFASAMGKMRKAIGGT